MTRFAILCFVLTSLTAGAQAPAPQGRSGGPPVQGAEEDIPLVGRFDRNGNKVATACQLRADVFKLGLGPQAYERLKVIAGSRMTTGGELIITARRFRTQEANREDARRRLAEMIAEAHLVQRKRKPTRPSKAAKTRRLDAKKGRGAIKAARGKVRLD